MVAAARIARPNNDEIASERAELHEIIRTRSFKRGSFILSSGKVSDLYFNLKPTMMSARGAYLSARAFLTVLAAEKADYLGGLEMGAIPLIGAVAAVGCAEGRSVSTFFVRKKPKDHGTRDLVEGLGPEERLDNRRVVIADDVATSGASIMKAIDAAKAAGAVVETAIVLLDREEGASAFLAEQGVKLVAIFTASDFVDRSK